MSDSDSGDAYSRWLNDASANPLVVGVEWFDYRDEPVSGRGASGVTLAGSSALVIGENFAFGMVDVSDTPKYDLINKVRASNLAVLANLGLISSDSAVPTDRRTQK